MNKLIFSLAIGFFVLGSLAAQSPAPVLLQAATPAPAHAAVVAKSQAADAPDTKDLLQVLQDMQTANTELLQKQAATLQALDDLQKAAEEIKSYGKRS